MEKVVKKTLSIGIILFWLFMLGMLYQKHYGPLWDPFHENLPVSESISFGDKDRWMGIYLKGEKIGYAHLSEKRKAEGYNIKEKVFMRLKVMGTTQKIDTVTEADFNSDYTLRAFDFRMVSDITSMAIKGEVRGKRMRISITTEGDSREEEIDIKDRLYLSSGLTEKFAGEGLKPGKIFKALIFDPLSMSQQELEIEVEGKEKIRVMGVENDAYRLRTSFKGINIFSWVDEKGETLREENPLGLLLVRESEKDAPSIGPVLGTDIITETSVISNIILKEPEKISYLKLRLKDVPLKGFDLSGGRQLLNGEILEIKKEDINRISNFKFQISKSQSGDRDFKEFLSSTPFIQSNDPRIIEKAKEIIGNEKDVLKAARLLMEWVYKSIEKKPTLSIPDAIDVLRTKQGDCNEHTTLFTALARSAGIPSKINIGLVYNKGAFYYHAWPEVYAGEWITIDPTLGQFTADATHIKFLEGELGKQVEILRIVGKLSIEILEYR